MVRRDVGGRLATNSLSRDSIYISDFVPSVSYTDLTSGALASNSLLVSSHTRCCATWPLSLSMNGGYLQARWLAK